MNKNYNLKLDLQFRCNNSIMKFNQFDNNTSDFFIKISNGGKSFDIEKAIVVLAIIKPSGKVASQFVEIENGLVYADLKPSMKDEIGTYTAKAMLILEDERVVTDSISYEVEEDKIFNLLNDTVEDTEDFTLLTDMLNRLSTIEISEEQRMINEAERILSEENRKIEESKRVEAELIRQHEEADRAKYDAIRESNENIRKQNESIRLANETNRIDEEAKRVEEESKRVEAEQLRKDNYNFMTEDEDRRRSEANSHKEAENLRVQAETNRVNEEAKRRTTEQARILAENTRVSNENTRKANEITRQNNETHRVEAETQRQNRYNSFILDAEANANNFENYTNSAKIKEEERKSNELNRKSQEDRRVSNEVERISNENTRKANEKARQNNETTRQNIFENKVDEVDTKISELNITKDNFVSSISTKVDNKISELDNAKSDMTTTVSNKVNEVENRFNALTSSQQQDAEVIDARDGETSLKARLDRDIEKAKQVYAPVEGSHISTDSSVGYAKDIEILGNTIQSASNLADIKSVGDKVEGQELYEIPVLSVGKNLLDYNNPLYENKHYNDKGNLVVNNTLHTYKIDVTEGVTYRTKIGAGGSFYTVWKGDKFVRYEVLNSNLTYQFTCDGTYDNIRYSIFHDREQENSVKMFYVYEGNTSEYEPYQEDKLTILSPTPLEKVGDVADRIIEKNGVWGVEKNVAEKTLSSYDVQIDNWRNDENSKSCLFKATDVKNINQHTVNIICDKLQVITYEKLYNYEVGISTVGGYDFGVRVLNSVLGDKSLKQYIDDNNIKVKYQTTQPQFIPLPHDQQIKLRTFAGKTNISFLTEIEGTIKAQVPKSIGATVNTHTEQINNLNKELDRVKKLEESTVSTVTTESDFTTVEATSNGYFEDVKLEGKTLVNLYNPISISPSPIGWNSMRIDCTRLEREKEYTFVINNLPNGFRYVITTVDDVYLFQYTTSTCIKFKMVDTKENYLVLHLNEPNMSSLTSEQMENLQAIILEGDHTQNPPSYFEGLKSVGQSATTSEDDVDEIVVSSVKFNTNMLNPNDFSSIEMLDNDTFKVVGIYSEGKVVEYQLKPNCVYNLKWTRIDGTTKWLKTTVNGEVLSGGNGDFIFTTDCTGKILFNCGYNSSNDKDMLIKDFCIIEKGENYATYTPHQSDKKRLLYYNEETQAWEKPILRQWDSIEKHANGKYYYHKRSAEVVFDGSEDEGWTKADNTDAGYSRFFNGAYSTPDKRLEADVICDKLPTSSNSYLSGALFDCIGGASGNNRINIKYSGDLTVSDLTNKLSNSPHTAVYQLAEEKVYECTNIDLITYANETNYIIESGAIVPKTTLKVHNNISNVVSLLQKKVSLLESNIKASQEVQDMMILETDMRMLDIELALMEFMPMTLNLGGSDMLRSATYFNFLKNHIVNETYEKEYLENVMNKYLATGRINQDEYDELYKMLYPPVYDIELPIEY